MEINFQLFKKWKLIINLSVNRNGKKLAVSRKKVKILTVNRKRHYPIETLLIVNMALFQKEQNLNC